MSFLSYFWRNSSSFHASHPPPHSTGSSCIIALQLQWPLPSYKQSVQTSNLKTRFFFSFYNDSILHSYLFSVTGCLIISLRYEPRQIVFMLFSPTALLFCCQLLWRIFNRLNTVQSFQSVNEKCKLIHDLMLGVFTECEGSLHYITYSIPFSILLNQMKWQCQSTNWTNTHTMSPRSS